MYTNRELGTIGERIAERWLIQHDFSVIQKNFYARGSEIDIIAEKEGSIHFIEVKCVIHETSRRYGRKVIRRANNTNRGSMCDFVENKESVIHETNSSNHEIFGNDFKNKDNVIHETPKKHRTKDKLIDNVNGCVNHETKHPRKGSVIHETQNGVKSSVLHTNTGNNGVIHETKGFYRPEDKVDVFKLKRMKLGIQQYLYLKDIKDIPIFIDVIAIVLYRKEGNWQADVKCIDNVIIE